MRILTANLDAELGTEETEESNTSIIASKQQQSSISTATGRISTVKIEGCPMSTGKWLTSTSNEKDTIMEHIDTLEPFHLHNFSTS